MKIGIYMSLRICLAHQRNFFLFHLDKNEWNVFKLINVMSASLLVSNHNAYITTLMSLAHCLTLAHKCTYYIIYWKRLDTHFWFVSKPFEAPCHVCFALDDKCIPWILLVCREAWKCSTRLRQCCFHTIQHINAHCYATKHSYRVSYNLYTFFALWAMVGLLIHACNDIMY